MMKLIIANVIYGPFKSVTSEVDRYVTDNCDLPFTVVGDAQVVDAQIPPDFIASDYDWVNNALVKKNIVAPKPPVPLQVTMRQARLALLQSGKLGAVDVAIASLSSPTKEEAQIEWEFSSTVERYRPLVAMLGQALALNDSQLDDLFILASTM